MLPSGRVVALAVRAGELPKRRRAKGAPLFSELRDVVDAGDLTLRDEGGAPLVFGDLALGEFHALRAIATRLGWLDEETVDFECRNCGAALKVRPCEKLALGPFVDRELGDDELDRTLDLAASHPIPDVVLPSGGVARDARFVAVTVSRAAALHRALRKRTFAVTSHVVRAMGVDALGSERDPARIARALSTCSEKAWSAITALFLDATYPPRLLAVVLCDACGARHDVDAPYEREFDRGRNVAHERASEGGAFPSFDEFDARAREIADELVAPYADDGVLLVVEGGVPACDDGGEPLLGSYVPPYAGDAAAPSRAPEVTVYYKTFRAIWDEDGPYDWAAELRETIEHELEHHEGHLRGHDPMDEDERRAIDDEAARVVGKRELVRSSVGALARDFGTFMRRTWPIWLVLLAITLLLTLGQR